MAIRIPVADISTLDEVFGQTPAAGKENSPAIPAAGHYVRLRLAESFARIRESALQFDASPPLTHIGSQHLRHDASGSDHSDRPSLPDIDIHSPDRTPRGSQPRCEAR
jgi:hypothetical protein